MIDFSRKTILFGGSFDPVHEGHLHVASQALRTFPDSQIVFVPANQSPGKSAPLASAALRLQWLKQVTSGSPFLVWDEEIQRGGTSYTVETLQAAHRQGAKKEKLFWIVGSDTRVSEWREPEKIRALCTLLVVERPGKPAEKLQPGDQLLSIPPSTASSTAIRTRLASREPNFQDLPQALVPELKNLILLSQNPYVRK